MGKTKLLVKNTLRAYSQNKGTDLAAALTYFSVLALFPAILALVSLLGIFGERNSINEISESIETVAPGQAADTITDFIKSLPEGGAINLALIIGLLSAVWAASGYVGAFGRALNDIYRVEEGRTTIKLKPVQALLTLTLLVMLAVSVTLIVVSGPVVEAVGEFLNLSSTLILVWNILKWPLLLTLVSVMIAALYHYSPNVRREKFKLFSTGSVFAVVVWLIASGGFAIYVGNFSNYDKTYGALAGVIIFLLWLWLTNNVLLVGAQINHELERLEAISEDETVDGSLDPELKDDTQIKKNEIKDKQLLRESGFTEKEESKSKKKPIMIVGAILGGFLAGRLSKK